MLDDRHEERVADLIEEMTLEEKVGQMVGVSPYEDMEAIKTDLLDHHIGSCHFGGTPYNTPREKAEFANEVQEVAIEESRLGIPLFLRAMAEHGHAAVAGSTVFPQQLGLAATRDVSLIQRCADITAGEMRATGVHSTSSPIGDVARDQRWGRVPETFGESPHLCGEMTAAMVHGYQGGDRDPVIAVTKHFPAYSEGVRGEDQAPNEISDYTLRRVHVPPYEAGINAGTGGIMPCYNSINGEPVHGSKRFVEELLRNDLGFDGFVLADARGAEDLHGGHQVSESREESIWHAVRAGIDILPFGGAEYAELIVGLVEDGELSEARVEESARRVLNAKFELGLFDDPFVDVAEAVDTLGQDSHREVALRAARESMTLLKNEGDVLPFSPDVDEVFVGGPNADEIAHQHGGWGNVQDPVPLGDTVLEGINDTVGSTTDVTYEQGTTINERTDIDAASDAAAEADVAVVVLGEPDYVHEFRGSSGDFEAEEFPNRAELTLPEAQLDLIRSVHETGTPTVAVLVTGRVLAIPWIAEHVPGILMAYQPGSEGRAVGDVIFGEHNPSGKLPVSIPKSAGHVPVRFNYLTHPTVDNSAHLPSYDPLYEYGHGLSYTDFEYESLELSEEEVGPDDTIAVEVSLSNTGDVSGTETIEVFANDVISSRATPVRELKRVHRVDLDPGEERTVSFTFDIEEFGVVQDDGTRDVEPGTIEILVEELVEEFEIRRRRSYNPL